MTNQPMIQDQGGDLEVFGSGSTLRQLQQFAFEHPRRDPKEILTRAVAELQIDQSRACAYYYAIPFKKHVKGCQTRNQPGDTCATEWVEGASAKAARTLLRLWGNCAVFGFVAYEDDDLAKVRALYIDFECNVMDAREATVSKWETSARSPYRLNDQRAVLKVAAGLSKMERNVTLVGIPEWLSGRFFDEAVQIAGQSGDRKTVGDLIAAFGRHGISEAHLAGIAGCKIEPGALDPEVLGKLRGMYGGLARGDTTAEEVLAGLGGHEKKPEPRAAPEPQAAVDIPKGQVVQPPQAAPSQDTTVPEPQSDETPMPEPPPAETEEMLF